MRKIEVIKTYYESNMGKGLPDYKVLGWESCEAQHMRFDMLLTSVDVNGKRILDIGCGIGNLLDYMKQKNIEAAYTGLDILPKMVQGAKNKNPDGDFRCLDIFKENPFEKDSFDIIYASGVFNLNLGNNKEFLFEALKLFLNLSREVVAFNLLHFNSPDREDKYYYFNPDDVKEMIEKLPEKVKKVNIIESYLENDFTVICCK